MVHKLARYAFTDAKDEPSTEKEVSLYDVMQAGLDTGNITTEINVSEMETFLDTLPVTTTPSNSKFYLSYEAAFEVPDGYIGADFNIPSQFGFTNASDTWLHLIYNDTTGDEYYITPGNSTTDYPVVMTDIFTIQNFLDTVVLPGLNLSPRDTIWQVNEDLTVTIWYSPAAAAAAIAGNLDIYFVGGTSTVNDTQGNAQPISPSNYSAKTSKLMLNTSSGIQSINGDSTSNINISYTNDVTTTEGITVSGGTLTLNTHAWGVEGNKDIDPMTQYLGTSDSVDLIIKTNNVESFRVSGATQNVLLGDILTIDPLDSYKLEINQLGREPEDGLGFVNGSEVWALAGSDPYTFKLFYGGTAIGVWDDTGAYASLSDGRLKENVLPVTNSEGIYQLNPVDFNFKTSPNKPQKGFIAQEVQTVYPHLVSGTDTLTLNMAGIIPMLVAEIQKLKADIEILKTNL